MGYTEGSNAVSPFFFISTPSKSVIFDPDRKFVRRTYAICLLICLLFQVAGYLVVFQVCGMQIRWELEQRMRSGIPDEDLVLIKIAGSEKQDHNFRHINRHEVLFDGMRYDIVRQESTPDAILFYCVSDEEETRLFSRFLEIFDGSDPDHSEKGNHRDLLLRLLESMSCMAEFDHCVQTAFRAAKMIPAYHFGLKTCEVEQPYPPPQSLF